MKSPAWRPRPRAARPGMASGAAPGACPTPLRSTWDPVTAYHMVRMAQASYCPRAEATRAALGLGYEVSEMVDVGSAEILLAAGPGLITISPRGTKGLLDLGIDALVGLTDRPGLPGEVHRGFSRQVMRAYAEVLECVHLYRKKYPEAKTAYAAHSMGGAVVPMLRYLMGGAVAYTFGAPRTGNRRFAETYDNIYGTTTFRVVHPGDLVARVPRFVDGYCHIGVFRQVPGRGSLLPGHDWAALRRARPVGEEESVGILGDLRDKVADRITDHGVKTYARNLGELAEQSRSGNGV